jgi:hypothetical protein
LTTYIDKVHAHLERMKESRSFELSSIVRKPARINEIPFEFRETIVKEVSGMGLANHEIRETSEEIMERPEGLQALMQPFQPPQGHWQI